MKRDGFSTAWTPCLGRATLLALAIASGCGARTAAPMTTAPAAATAPAAPLDEEGCLALLVSEPAARVRCDDDDRGPCVSQIMLEHIQTSPARYVCFVLVVSEDWEPFDGDEIQVGTSGTSTLAVLDHAAGAWAVGYKKDYDYSVYHASHKGAWLEIATIGPDRKALVVSESDGEDAYGTTNATFYLVTSGGLTEILWFSSEVRLDGKKEYSYRVDDKVTTAGYHDIVLTVEETGLVAPEGGEGDGGSPGSWEERSWEERYRWNGKEYVQVESEADAE